ncbi:hypothetical protein BV083_1648 [Haemophilus influenzae]|nr:hypothetical protein BV083_1648 [Haemophilus influenzae]
MLWGKLLKQPTTNNQQPTTNNQQPTTNNQKYIARNCCVWRQ